MEEDTWALELEEELELSLPAFNQTSTAKINDATSPRSHGAIQQQEEEEEEEEETKKPKEEPEQVGARVAMELPLEVLIHIFSFVQVGRVCKAWSLAMTTLARRIFAARLRGILQPFAADAPAIAQQVETALYAMLANNNSCTLPKAYGQKARQLLFNLRDEHNHSLRERLVTGELTAATLVRMNASDMANPQLVRQRKEWIKKRTHEVMRDIHELNDFTESDMFECRSCGCSRTRYRQWRRKTVVDRTRVIIICSQCTYRWEL